MPAEYCTYFNKVDLVINEYDKHMARHNELISQKDIEELLSIKASGVIPFDKKIIVSQNQGIPVVSLKARVNAHFMKLTNRFNRLEIIKGECLNEV